eukprot:gene7902-biopygen47
MHGLEARYLSGSHQGCTCRCDIFWTRCTTTRVAAADTSLVDFLLPRSRQCLADANDTEGKRAPLPWPLLCGFCVVAAPAALHLLLFPVFYSG